MGGFVRISNLAYQMEDNRTMLVHGVSMGMPSTFLLNNNKTDINSNNLKKKNQMEK